MLVTTSSLHSVAAAQTVTPPVEPGAYRALSPTRIVDTRIGLGAPKQSLAGDVPFKVLIAGRGGVPTTGVSAVAVNFTITQPTTVGVLTVYAGTDPAPNASTLNYLVGQTVANLAVVKLGTDGTVAALPRMAGRVQLVMDLQGYYLAGNAQAQGAFVPVTPTRIVDTRTGLGGLRGPVAPGYQPGGSLAAVATSAAAVVANVTVTGATGSGYIQSAESANSSSIVNFSRGTTVANIAVLAAQWDRTFVLVEGTGSVQVIIDIYGYYVTGPRPGFLSKNGTLGSDVQRVLDTRDGTGGFRGAVTGGTTLTVAMPPHPFGPLSSVGTVAINLTVVSATGTGYLAAYPTGSTVPSTSNINFSPGQLRANMSFVGVGTGNAVSIRFGGTGSIAVIVDVEAATLGADIPPQTALNLASSNVTSTTLSLTWDPPQYGSLTGYIVRRAEGASAPATPTDGVQIAAPSTSASSNFPLNDACLTAGTTYTYSVFTEEGSTISAPATLTVTTQPAPTPNGMVAWGDASVDHFSAGYLNAVRCGHPEVISSLANVQQASTIGGAYYALKSDGTVWGFGNGVDVWVNSRSLSLISSDVPVQVVSFEDVVQIAASLDVIYMLRRDGSVWELGDDTSRSDGGFTGGGNLVQLPGLQNMVSISTSTDGLMWTNSIYGVKADGTLWGWGADNAGQFPSSDVDTICNCVRQPLQLFGFTDITGVAQEASTAFALHRDGTISAWGGNTAGQLGDGGSEKSTPTPVSVAGISNATDIYADPRGLSAYALLSDGTVRSWGANYDGELGDGTTTNRNTPVVVAGLASVRSVVAGGGELLGYATATAVLSDGSVVRWGASPTGAPTSPAAIPGLTGVASIIGLERSGFLYVEG